MFRRYRQRRGPYAMAAPSVVPSVIRTVILLGIVVLFLFFAGKWILWLFGAGGDTQRTAVTLTVEDRGTVNVSLEGGLLQRAQDTLKLYEGDRITTGGNGHAIMSFFDGSLMRMDVQSDVNIAESEEATDDSESSIDLELAAGSLWVRTPDLANFSGAIVRRISTPRFEAILPSDTEAVIDDTEILVFSADGEGIELRFANIEDAVFIGEGQQIQLPDGEITSDPLAFRSAIEPLAVQREFIEESRSIKIDVPVTGTGSVTGDDMLSVSAPADRQTVAAATVKVEGTVAQRVERVRINGNNATISRADGSFTLELALEEEGDTTITIEALDARGVTLEKETRTVIRGSEAITSPTITSPAKTGETYRTQQTEFAITGTAPAGAAGIMVNEYKLQLFRAGNPTWSYLASVPLGNMKQGSNVYDVYALDAAGNKSAPARITILLEAGSVGVVGGGVSSAATSSQAQVSESTLPNNAPLMPGTLSVTGPTSGNSHTATGSEFLIEGTTPTQTSSVWVNGYRLQLYTAGKTYWNYIANTQFGTLKRGTNVYRIVARNSENQILDVFEYTVTYNP